MMLKQCLYICAIFGIVVQSAKLPNKWMTCKNGDPKNNECLKEAIQGAIRDLSSGGNPSLGVLPLDPLHFDAIAVDQGEGPVSIKLEFSDLDIVGFKDLTIRNVKNDWKLMQVDLVVPKLTLAGKYKIKGQVLLLPITGDGDCKLIFTDYKANAKLKIKEIKKGDKKYYEVFDFHIATTAEKVFINFDNLFNGDKALGNNMNVFLNENSQEIIKELGPAISRAFGTAFKEISNRIFSKVPTNEISP